jgi:hypothetical protein
VDYFKKENNTMNETLKNNYYALLIAITKGKTAKESLLAMGICPDSENNLARRTEREAKANA